MPICFLNFTVILISAVYLYSNLNSYLRLVNRICDQVSLGVSRIKKLLGR